MSQPILSNYDSTRRATSTRKWEFSSRHKGPGQFLTDPGLPGLVFVTVQVVSQDEVVKLACRVQPALREMNQDRIESVNRVWRAGGRPCLEKRLLLLLGCE